MNKHPLRDVTQEDIDTYHRDGVVCLRNVFDQDWIDLLTPPTRRVAVEGDYRGMLPTAPLRNPGRVFEEVRKFSFHSPLAEVAGKLMQSKEIRYFFEEFFAKSPQSKEQTIWHADRAGWPVSGQMVPSIWIPLTPIVHENCLQVLAESHKQDVMYWLFSPNARKMIQPDDRPNHPDGESLRGHPDARFLTWEMDPGDLLFVHPWALHYATGNPTDDWRMTISCRVFGDDIRWDPRPDCLNLPGIGFDEMIPGEKPMGANYPLLWSQDGRSDPIEAHPKGFSASWSDDAYERMESIAMLNSKGFEKWLANNGDLTPLTLPFGASKAAE